MPVDIDVIREAALTRLESDSAFQTLTGATAGDSRVTLRHTGDAGVSATQPAFVTYTVLPQGETHEGVSQPKVSFVVWAQEQSYEAMSDVATRIRTLFDRQRWTAGSLTVWSRVVNEGDLDEPTSGFIGRMLHVRIGTLDLAP
jgi:hypothetical protein